MMCGQLQFYTTGSSIGRWQTKTEIPYFQFRLHERRRRTFRAQTDIFRKVEFKIHKTRQKDRPDAHSERAFFFFFFLDFLNFVQ